VTSATNRDLWFARTRCKWVQPGCRAKPDN
jgi:hypothetical protein